MAGYLVKHRDNFTFTSCLTFFFFFLSIFIWSGNSNISRDAGPLTKCCTSWRHKHRQRENVCDVTFHLCNKQLVRDATPVASWESARSCCLVSCATTNLWLQNCTLTTPRQRVFLETISVHSAAKKFPAFMKLRRFRTVLTKVEHWSLSWASVNSVHASVHECPNR
jgi:hypothetical protein